MAPFFIGKPKEEEEDLLFSWGLLRRRRWSLMFFLLLSLAVHAFAFYLFRPVARGDRGKLTSPYRISLLSPEFTATWKQARIASGETIPPAQVEFLGPTPTESGLRFSPSFAGHSTPLRSVSWTPGLGVSPVAFVDPGSEPRALPGPPPEVGQQSPDSMVGVVQISFSGPLAERCLDGRLLVPWSGESLAGTSCLIGVNSAGHIVSVLPASGGGELSGTLATLFKDVRLRPGSSGLGEPVAWGWASLSHPALTP